MHWLIHTSTAGPKAHLLETRRVDLLGNMVTLCGREVGKGSVREMYRGERPIKCRDCEEAVINGRR